eukprot:13930389-Heterocapsa_arctica.AAC.1
MFISPEHQTAGQIWMANCLIAPFKRAIYAYTAYLVANELTHSRVDDNRGADDSTAATYAAVEGDIATASLALRVKM